MPKARDPIGVFDSGVGGLSVLRELRRLLPGEKFIFFADQTYVPYGGKTAAQLQARTARIARFLLRHRCKMIVVACNTATCYAIDSLRSTFPVSFIGTVPAVKPACALTNTGVVGVIATPATAKSPVLKKLIREHANGTRVIRVGCTGLEDLVEQGNLKHPGIPLLLEKFLVPLKTAGADVVVLGCTHFPFLKPLIRSISGARTVDSGRAIAMQTRRILTRDKLRSPRAVGSVSYFTTGSKSSFSRAASALLSSRVKSNKVHL